MLTFLPCMNDRGTIVIIMMCTADPVNYVCALQYHYQKINNI